MKIENLLIKVGIGFCTPFILLMLAMVVDVVEVTSKQGWSGFALFVIGTILLLGGCSTKYDWFG